MDLASSRNTWRFSSGCKWEEGGVRLNMTSAAALARVSGTYAVTWEKCLVGVVRVLRSAASGRRRAGFRARQGGGVVELEAREHRQLQRRTAPACHAEYRLPDSAPPPIALHCSRRKLSPPNTPRRLAAPPPASPPTIALRRRVPSWYRLHLISSLQRPRSLQEAHTRAACNHPMLRHNHITSPTALSAAPLATGIGFGHAACPAT
jgi:hypothetical protein